MSDPNHPNQQDELTQQRQNNIQQRQQHATERAQALSNLMLGEILDLGPETSVMGVPNGWLFTQTHKAGITSTFVPAPQAPPPQIKREPTIVMPT